MQDRDPIHILVTGAAGFIGFHLCQRLLKDGYRVTGVDSVDGKDDSLGRDRLATLGIASLEGAGSVRSRVYPAFNFFRADICSLNELETVFTGAITHVIHLAARVGVRQSVSDPRPYLDSNVSGFFNVLELSRRFAVRHLVFASSSSVYGLTNDSPFRVDQNTDHPASFYAATKKANEMFAHSYAYLHALPVTGLRFFTVYGPWGRTDMAPYLFTRNIVDEKPIRVFNHGRMRRDFTYVTDIVEGIVRIFDRPPAAISAAENLSSGRSHAPFRIYNIGRGAPVDIMDFIREIEVLTGKQAQVVLVDHQPGDVEETFSDVSDLQQDFGYRPQTDLKAGLKAFWEWFSNYYLGK